MTTCDGKHWGASCGSACWLDRPIGMAGARRLEAELEKAGAFRARAEAAQGTVPLRRRPASTVMHKTIYTLHVDPPAQHPLDFDGVIDVAPGLHLRIGLDNPLLARWMIERRVRSLAIITSTNPGGDELDSATNAQRWSQLMQVTHLIPGRHRVTSRPGVGRQEYEKQIAIENMDKDWARNLARRFGQVAFVWVELVYDSAHTQPMAVPELIFVEDPP